MRVAGRARARSDLVDYAALASAPGFARLCQWMALPHLQACSLVALAKRDATSLESVLRHLNLDAPWEVPAAMAVCCAVSNARDKAGFARGVTALSGVMGRLALTYNVKDRRAAEVSALVMRLAQGDASPLSAFALRLGIGKRDVPFFAGVSLLAHAAPCDPEEGEAGAKWILHRHAHTATRRLTYVLGIDERLGWALIEAGRGLPRGLRTLAPRSSSRSSGSSRARREARAKAREQAENDAEDNDVPVAPPPDAELLSVEGAFVLCVSSRATARARTRTRRRAALASRYGAQLDPERDDLLKEFFASIYKKAARKHRWLKAGKAGKAVIDAEAKEGEKRTTTTRRRRRRGRGSRASSGSSATASAAPMTSRLARHTLRPAMALLEYFVESAFERIVGCCVRRREAAAPRVLPLPARYHDALGAAFGGRGDRALPEAERRGGDAAGRAAQVRSSVVLRGRDASVRLRDAQAHRLPRARRHVRRDRSRPPSSDCCAAGRAATRATRAAEDHPLVFLLRFARGRASCFDVLPPGARARARRHRREAPL